ncbi:DUF3592 domain-containing protein [Bernardetia sp. OM2101]|uniref:DUF3592 domain-containing protein n=1 Tax=Bernardetia sp. OM2101 TaxID=3344876 RepID=UPI0035CECD78
MLRFLYGFFILLGCVFLGVGIYQYYKTKDLLNTGINTTATVIGFVRHSEGNGASFAPIFEYYTPNKEKRTFKSEVASNPALYDIGEKEKIIYDIEDNENVKTLSFWGLYLWTVVFCSVATPFLIIGLVYFLRLWRSK